MTGLGYWRSPGNEVQVQVPVIDGLGLGAVTGVPVHLAAAGLGGGELDLSTIITRKGSVSAGAWVGAAVEGAAAAGLGEFGD